MKRPRNNQNNSFADRWRFAEAAVADSRLSMKARLVAFALCTFHNDATGRCDPSAETLARAAGFDGRRATAIEAISELVAAEWVTIVGRSRGGRTLTNSYLLNFDKAINGTADVQFTGENGTADVPFEAPKTVRKRYGSRTRTQNHPPGAFAPGGEVGNANDFAASAGASAANRSRPTSQRKRTNSGESADDFLRNVAGGRA